MTLQEVFQIDENGYITEKYIAEFDEESNCLNQEELPNSNSIVFNKPPNGLYRPRWTGVKWIEDMSQEEMNQLNNQPKETTEIEILRDYVLEIDYKLVLMELGIEGGL